jgi:hypothetical protein
MSSEEELFAKLDRWLKLQPAEPNIFEVVQTRDAELFAAYVLRHFRAAAREAVAERLTREAGKLQPETWERAGAIATLIDWLSVTWGLSVAEQVTLLGLTDEADLASMRGQSPQDASHELLERLAMLMDIYQALSSLLPGRERADGWLRRPNSQPLFESKSPMATMLERGRLGIRNTRAYLWAQIWST